MLKKIILHFALFVLLINLALAYSPNSPTAVHQYIANESKGLWSLIPHEIKSHISNPLNTDISDVSPLSRIGGMIEADYDSGDDVIDGSGEEDVPAVKVRNHLWEPDNPGFFDNYNDGVHIFGSNYRKAMDIWTTRVIPHYLRGDINQSYYWLGRVVHLLEDLTVPAHSHNDDHLSIVLDINDDAFEEYASSVFNNYKGSNYSGKQYNYDNLPNMSNFNWKEVEPTNPTDRQNIELFRLFWYTAQKAQYFASDNVDGNFIYVNLSDDTKNFSISLWDGENVKIVNRSLYLATDDITNSGDNVSVVANASIPHAMKAVAGLYRLFDDAVRIDWPTENHNFRRTGFTLLKGDLATTKDIKNQVNLVLDVPISTENVVKPTVADLDNNNFMDSVVLIHKTTFNTITKMAGVETHKNKFPYIGTKYKTVQKWPIYTINGGAIYFPATLANIDSDSRKEIITGVRNGTIYAYDVSSSGTITQKWAYYLEERLAPLPGTDEVAFNGGNVVDDIDLDGNNEVIFADVGPSVLEANWNGKVYVLDGSGSSAINETSYNVGNGGTYASVSLANVDSDDNPEIIVPTQ